MTRESQAVQVGVVGMGGYAGSIIHRLLTVGPQMNPPLKLAAVCDPAPGKHAQLLEHLRQQAVVVHDDVDQMLATEALRTVWLPVPIGLHASMTIKTLEAGRIVMCEKPAAATLDEVDAMLAARDRAGLPVLIGYQSIYESMTVGLKRRLLDGELGRINRVTIHACTPRTDAYYARSAWAGRIKHQGQWVLDSPVQNALAHPVNLALYLMGASQHASAEPTWVEAELYRAADIENFDTISARVMLDAHVPMLIHLTHACEKQVGPVLRIEGEQGQLIWQPDQVLWRAGGRCITLPRPMGDEHAILRQLACVSSGRPDPSLGLATLEIARAHTLLVHALSRAASVLAVPSDCCHARQLDACKHPGRVLAINGIHEAFEACTDHFQMLHESARLPFTHPAVRLNLATDLSPGPVASATP